MIGAHQIMDWRRPEVAFEEGIIDLEPGVRVDALAELSHYSASFHNMRIRTRMAPT